MKPIEGKVGEIVIKLGRLPFDQEVKVLFDFDEEDEPQTPKVSSMGTKNTQAIFHQPLNIPDILAAALTRATYPSPPEPQKETVPEPYDYNNRWFVQMLKSILKDNANKRMVGNKLFGDIQHKKLYKISTSDRIFMRRGALLGSEYSVCIVVDCSNSMSENNKMEIACSSVTRLVDAFRDMLPIAVVSFNDNLKVVKTFERKVDRTELEKFHRSIWLPGTYTHDNEGVRKATELLRVRRGKRIMIVLSDGGPMCAGCKSSDPFFSRCGGNRYLLERYLHEAIASAEQQKIRVIGIGIKSDAVKIFYPTYKVILNVNELFPTILSVLKRVIKRDGGV